MRLIDLFLSSIMFWMAWLIIPFLMEILPAIFHFLFLFFKKRVKYKELQFFPDITIIVPVYNSMESLRACIASIRESDYPVENIEVMLVNNEGKDDSFTIFTECQREFSDLNMIWMNARQGKSKALNLALFNSKGQYIIHIDSDGVLEKSALRNMVTLFEADRNTDCMTGTILTSPEMIDETEGRWMRIVRKIEFMEYGQAFLAGRKFEENFNSIYTLSGAFSAFRKSTIMKTQLYHTDTVCEDTQITFQVRQQLKKKVKICTNAIFFVDPIEDINRLYTQRQRWQRGEIEVAHLFLRKGLKCGRGFFNDFAVRLLMFDHTYAFPRMIWYFALIFLVFLDYPVKLVVMSVMIIFFLYMISAFLYFMNAAMYLREFKELKKYYTSKWCYVLLLPIYNFVLFWFRFAGIINSIKGEQTWRVRNLTEEKDNFTAIIRSDFSKVGNIIRSFKKRVNQDEE